MPNMGMNVSADTSGAEPARMRTVTWQDPRPAAEAARRMSGLDYMRAVARGDFPGSPIWQLMNLSLIEADDGLAVFSSEPEECYYNPMGVTHGGFAATILDSALYCAVHTTLPLGIGATTLELKINLVRPITAETGRVICRGAIVHRGATIATSEARLIAERTGKLLAHGTTTCLLRPWAPTPGG